MTKQTKPDQVSARPTISLPYEQDRIIAASIMSCHGIGLSAAIRVALREYAEQHGVIPETLAATADEPTARQPA